MSSNSNLETDAKNSPLTLLADIVGSEFVLHTPLELAPYLVATTPAERRIRFVVRPSDTEEVCKIVHLANAYSIALQPISAGNNWGYGSSLPVSEDIGIVDLSRMNRILELNEELAYVVIEPGVTQGQLADYLKENNIPLRFNPTGAGPKTSVLGNFLERGYTLGRYGDRHKAFSSLELVLPDASVLETGFAGEEGVRCQHVYPYGVGPYLDGLFVQSNFGLITKVGIWLDPIPERLEVVFFGCSSEQLPELVEEVRSLLFTGAFPEMVNFASRERVLTTRMQYPWTEMNNQIPLSEAIGGTIASKKGLSEWTAFATLSGSASQVRLQKQLIRRALGKKVSWMRAVSERKIKALRWYERIKSPFRSSTRQKSSLEQSFDLLTGSPSELALKTPYWRNRQKGAPERDINPAIDNCGLIWCSPVVPTSGKDVRDFLDIVPSVLKQHGFDFCATLTAISPRCFVATAPILYDRNDPDSWRQAKECYGELSSQCHLHGFPFYRYGSQAMESSIDKDLPYWKFVRRLKNCIDPADIIAPGRYDG